MVHRRGAKHAHHAKPHVAGKKAVYMTPYRNAAVEVAKMYERKGERAEIEAERDSAGHPLFVVYILPKGIY